MSGSPKKRNKRRGVPQHRKDVEAAANHDPVVEFQKPALEPKKIPALKWRTRGKFALAGGAAAGGTAILYRHHQNTRRTPVGKALVPTANVAERLAGHTGRATSASRKALGRAEPHGELSRRLVAARRGTVTKLYDPFTGNTYEFAKRDNDASAGRYAAGAVVPFGLHGAVAGKPGRKLRATGNEFGGAAAGGYIGRKFGGRTGVTAALLGAGLGVARNQRMGNYKPQKVKVGKTDIPPTNVRYISALLPTGSHVSHAMDLGVYHPSNPGRRVPRSMVPVQVYRKGRQRA